MARNLTMDDAVFTILLSNGGNLLFVAPLLWAKKFNNILRAPQNKIIKLVLENDFRIQTRSEFVTTVIVRPHNFAKDVEQIPRAEEASVEEIKTTGDFGEDL